MTLPQKFGGIIQISHEARWLNDSGEYRRRIKNVTTTPVTDQQRAAHARSVEALEYLESYAGYSDGCTDYEPSIEPLQPAETTEYAETVEEWRARCRLLDQERGVWRT